MRLAVMAVPGLLSLLVLVPAASAGFSPSLYYLAPDGADGALSEEAPEGESPSSAFVTALPADAASAAFVALEGPRENATHVLGRVLVGLWADVGVAQGSVEARLVLVRDGTVTPLASAAQPISTDPSEVPEPTALLPPDPTDPQGAVFHAAAQVMPLLSHPPFLLDLGVLDMEVPEGAVAGVELRLVEDNATGAPASGIVRVQYAAATTPSFVYVPWWSEDPEASGAPGSPRTPSQPGPGGGSGPSGGGGASDPDDDVVVRPGGQNSPGLPLVLLLALVAAAAAVRRP